MDGAELRLVQRCVQRRDGLADNRARVEVRRLRHTTRYLRPHELGDAPTSWQFSRQYVTVTNYSGAEGF
jgi:hypothetical protein